MKYQIRSTTREEFESNFLKLRKLGFVYGNFRIKTLPELYQYCAWQSYILIGYNPDCKLILHGSLWQKSTLNWNLVTVDEFIENKWYEKITLDVVFRA
jgi:hypothetical protein